MALDLAEVVSLPEADDWASLCVITVGVKNTCGKLLEIPKAHICREHTLNQRTAVGSSSTLLGKGRDEY